MLNLRFIVCKVFLLFLFTLELHATNSTVHVMNSTEAPNLRGRIEKRPLMCDDEESCIALHLAHARHATKKYFRHRCAPPIAEEQLWAFVHIPKCGGSSIESVLKHFSRTKKPNGTLDTYYAVLERGQSVAHPHETYSTFLDHFSTRHFDHISYMTMLRNPIDTYISNFFYVNSFSPVQASRSWPNKHTSLYGENMIHGLQKYTNINGFNGYLMNPKLVLPKWWGEELTSQFPKKFACADYRSSVYNLLANFAVVGVLERGYDMYDVLRNKSHLFIHSLDTLLERYGHINKQRGHKTVTPIERDAITKYFHEHAYCEIVLWKVAGQIQEDDLACNYNVTARTRS